MASLYEILSLRKTSNAAQTENRLFVTKIIKPNGARVLSTVFVKTSEIVMISDTRSCLKIGATKISCVLDKGTIHTPQFAVLQLTAYTVFAYVHSQLRLTLRIRAYLQTLCVLLACEIGISGSRDCRSRDCHSCVRPRRARDHGGYSAHPGYSRDFQR